MDYIDNWRIRMTRAEEVLKAMAEAKKVKRTPLRVKDKEGVRRRQAAQFSLAKLLASTKQLLPYFNKHNKIEMSSAIYHPRTQQLVVRAQVRSLTDKSRTAYPETITFFRVTSKEQADAVHKTPEGRPFVNPEKLPGLCKHLHGTMQKLIQMKVLGN